MKRIKYALFGLLAVILVMLTGCSKATIRNVNSNYHPTAMTTVIKGKTAADEVRYKVEDQKWQKVKVKTNTFVISMPRSNQTQKVQLKADAATKNVTIKKATPIMALPKFLATYAFATQQNPTALQLDPTLATKTDFNGKIAVKEGTQIRAVVSNSQLMGLTLVAESKKLNTTEGLNEFGSTLGTLAGVTGADAKKVLKEFADSTKSVKKGKTTIDTIQSKGVKFDVAFSEKNIYIYVTR